MLIDCLFHPLSVYSTSLLLLQSCLVHVLPPSLPSLLCISFHFLCKQKPPQNRTTVTFTTITLFVLCVNFSPTMSYLFRVLVFYVIGHLLLFCVYALSSIMALQSSLVLRRP